MSSISFKTFDKFGGWSRAAEELVLEIKRTGARRILEVGAGANPTLTASKIEELGVQYTTNDISQDELNKADPVYRKLKHDFSDGEVPRELHSCFDLVVSRMVNEHVRNGRLYHRNLRQVLSCGGHAIHWFSTLYALPFLVNWLLPDGLTDRMLSFFSPRDSVKHGKFRAYYSWSRGPSQSMIHRFEGLGYRCLQYNGYFGHGYYAKRLALLHRIELLKAGWLVRHPIHQLTSYAKVVLVAV